MAASAERQTGTRSKMTIQFTNKLNWALGGPATTLFATPLWIIGPHFHEPSSGVAPNVAGIQITVSRAAIQGW